MDTAWESELARFLADLLTVQEETLQVLAKKRELLIRRDLPGLAEMNGKEQEVISRLEECLKRREELLRRAAADGRPAASITSLAGSLPKDQAKTLAAPLRDANTRSRLLQHQTLANWVFVQRSLLHLAQMLEIIATGGQLQPTYGRGEPAAASGALVDRAA